MRQKLPKVAAIMDDAEEDVLEAMSNGGEDITPLPATADS